MGLLVGSWAPGELGALAVHAGDVPVRWGRGVAGPWLAAAGHEHSSSSNAAATQTQASVAAHTHHPPRPEGRVARQRRPPPGPSWPRTAPGPCGACAACAEQARQGLALGQQVGTMFPSRSSITSTNAHKQATTHVWNGCFSLAAAGPRVSHKHAARKARSPLTRCNAAGNALRAVVCLHNQHARDLCTHAMPARSPPGTALTAPCYAPRPSSAGIWHTACKYRARLERAGV